MQALTRISGLLPVAVLSFGVALAADADPKVEPATPATARGGAFQEPSRPAVSEAASNAPVTRDEFNQLKRQNDELLRFIQDLQNSRQAENPDVERLKRENEKLRRKVSPPIILDTEGVQDAVSRKYSEAPDNPVTTRTGKLRIGGLLQAWYYYIHNDTQSYIDAKALSGVPPGYNSGDTVDNDSFRVRRALLRFDLDVHEYISGHLMIDPAAEAASFPSFPSNVGSGYSGESDVFYNSGFQVTQDGQDFLSTPAGNVHNDSVRNGSAESGRLLQDAYINFHGWIPHHDISVGQMRRKIGEEGYRDDGELDFAERSMITQPASVRDLGIQLRGTWWDDRVQYWAGAFNGAGTAFQPRYNRADDNDNKDLLLAFQGRPLWNMENWGSLELGYSLLYGRAGESGGRLADLITLGDGLQRTSTVRVMQHAYAHYMPGGPMRGFWLRGEWGQYRDRFAPGQVATYPDVPVMAPAAFKMEGFYLGGGYRLSKSIWADSLGKGSVMYNSILMPMEFTFRTERAQNLLYQDLVYPTRHIDMFPTYVYTMGLNYYIKGHNAKIQVNYNWVNENDKIDGLLDQHQAREVQNNNLVVNFQLSW